MRTPVEPPLPVSPGDVVAGKYRVERVLGRGGMGFVVAARHEQIGHMVALKLLLPEVSGHEAVIERFLREAKAAVQLKSLHATRVSDVGVMERAGGPPLPYLVMEFLEGGSLGDLSRNGGLPIREAMLYVSQACEAVDEAHRNGIVHRDIKPDNLFLTRDAKGAPLIKVLDFGISKLPVTTVDDMRLTGTKDVMGTPLYMSPEQMQSARSADPRSDIWALGVTLFELLTGDVPFSGGTVAEIVARVLAAKPKPPSALRPGISPELDSVVLRCMEKDPEHRFQSARELQDALAPLLAAAAVTEATVTVRQVPLAVAGGSTAAPVSWHAPTVSTRKPPARRSRNLLVGGAVAAVIAGLGLVVLRSVSGPPPSTFEQTPAPADAPSAMASTVAPLAQDPAPSATASAAPSSVAVEPAPPATASASARRPTAPSTAKPAATNTFLQGRH
jgi:serine/threonine protein kinase